MNCHWSHFAKNCLDWDSNPRPGNVEFEMELELAQYAELQHTIDTQSNPRCRGKQGKRPMIAYCFTQCSNGCSLGSLLFKRQDSHGQRCTRNQLTNVVLESRLQGVTNQFRSQAYFSLESVRRHPHMERCYCRFTSPYAGFCTHAKSNETNLYCTISLSEWVVGGGWCVWPV